MKEKYIELMEKTLSAYSLEHIKRYFSDVKEHGLTEHGFPRLTVNIGILIAHRRREDLFSLFVEMMDFCCESVPNRLAANDFSVREMICCIEEIEKSGAVEQSRINFWKNSLAKINIELTYNKFAKKPTDTVRNWALFTAVSEFYRQSAGLCDSADFIELQLLQQLQWLDENGMYRDNEESDIHQPIVYDLVSRGLFTLLLNRGYRGKYYTEIDSALKKSALITLDMQSPNGEIPFGGRSNQFLHNEPWLCIICEYEAKRYTALGEHTLANKFRSAVKKALSVTEKWLSKEPIRHIKNRFPTETQYGCEEYAYFDKYMITTASMLYGAYSVSDGEATDECFEENKPCITALSPYFHKLFMKGFGYGLEFDLSADPHYDSSGLGRVHYTSAPSVICLSCPCTEEPTISLDDNPKIAFSLCSATKNGAEWIFGANSKAKYRLVGTSMNDGEAYAGLRCAFENGAEILEEYFLNKEGVEIIVSGEGEVGFALPAFDFDGERNTEITLVGKTLTVAYEGYKCEYSTGGKITDLDLTAYNRNGFYKAFVASGKKKIRVKVKISEC